LNHLQPYQPREVISLPLAENAGWRLKRYAILAEGRKFDATIATAALDAAVQRLPAPGNIESPDGNHGVGFQIIHFAEVAVVPPVFYWIWGSVLANTPQIRARWNTPTQFEDGVDEVIGCIWELEIVTFEAAAWKETMLNGTHNPEQKLLQYLNHTFQSKTPISKKL